MSEENKAEEAEVSEAEETDADESQATPSPKSKRKPIIIVAILAVLCAAGVGGWIWHEQPSFCSTLCHNPMIEYYDTYLAQAGETSEDKYGNTVSDGSTMLAATHREFGEGCLDCHVPTIGELVHEGIGFVSGNYYYPLYERDLDDLTTARKLENDAFCLNRSCHHVAADGSAIDSREALEAATEDWDFNPHASIHGDFDCSDCHKAHRASVYTCVSPGCHSDVDIPSGWLTPEEASEILLYPINPDLVDLD